MNAQSSLRWQQNHQNFAISNDPYLNGNISPGLVRIQLSSGLGTRLPNQDIIEESMYQPKIIKGFNRDEPKDNQQSWLAAKKQSITGSDPYDSMFYRSVTSSMGTNIMRQSYNNYESMAKTFGEVGPIKIIGGIDSSQQPQFESGSLPPQHRMLKIKQLQPIKHSVSMKVPDDKNLSLGETLRQNRVLKEHIERERAEINQSRVMQQEISLRIRPATPRLNLLKMKQQLPLMSQQMSGGKPGVALQKLPDQAQLRKRKKPHRLAQLQPLTKLPDLPQLIAIVPDIEIAKQNQGIKKQGQKTKDQGPHLFDSTNIAEISPIDLTPQIINDADNSFTLERDSADDENFDFYVNKRDDLSSEHELDEFEQYDEEAETMVGGALISNFQEKFEEIIENHEVSDAIDLNEKFLAEHLGVRPEELSTLKKIELRVDTSCHNLQVTGEILCSLESLRMSDSIIKCFRDIGTSFRFVRILHLARCELKEVQGIQAFLNLEELYISYNQIDDLFNIGFMEYLQVLDLEGNNVKGLEELNSLKRCKSLTDVNLKHNPISYQDGYYEKIIECVPSLENLDDNTNFNYVSDFKTVSQTRIENIVKESELIQRLMKLCQIEHNHQFDQVQTICQVGFQIIDTDETDMIIMANSIKSYPPEKKAQRQFFDNVMLECDTDEVFRKTFSSSLRGATPKKGARRPVSGFRNSAGNSFSNASTRKSTAMLKENDQCIANQSDEKKSSVQQLSLSDKLQTTHQSSSRTKTILTINKSRIKPASILSQNSLNGQLQITESQERLPQDIFSLISDTDVNLKQSKDIIKNKLTQNPSLPTFQIGDVNTQQQYQQSSKSAGRMKKLQNPYVEIQSQDQNGTQASSSQGFGGQASNVGPQVNLVKGIVPRYSAENNQNRIILRAKDIQFTPSFKNVQKGTSTLKETQE